MRIVDRLRLTSIQAKIAVWTGLCLLLLSTFLITYAALKLHDAALAAVEERAVEIAQANALTVNESITDALVTVRTLAEVLAAGEQTATPVDDLTREQVNLMMRQIVIDNPQFVEVYTVWEPDAFDEHDTQFTGQASSGSSRRFMASWNRHEAGEIQGEASVGYHAADNGRSYQCPRRTRQACILEPYTDSVQGEAVLMTSLVVPILVDDRFAGIVGVAISLDVLQTLANEGDIFNGTGRMLFMSHQGKLVAVTGQPELVGQSGSVLHDQFDEVLDLMQSGKELVAIHENHLHVSLPLTFGQTGTPWSISILVPIEAIRAEANQQAILLIGIGVVLTAAALGMLWILAGQISYPIREITTVVSQVAAGKLDVESRVDTSDEIGRLAMAFNGMIGSLRQTIETERHAHEAMQRARLEEQRAAAQEQIIATQQDTLRELSTPLIPVADGVVVLPLIGALDTQRAQQVMETLLEGVAQHRAHTAILDITGVLLVDTQVAAMLIQVAQAVRLMGAQVVLTGIQPQIAQTLVQLGVDLSDIITRGSLQAGIAAVLQHQPGQNPTTHWRY